MTIKKTVFVADITDGLEAISPALRSHFDLTCCSSAQEARSLLTNRFDLIICGMHFDECRMFDFLKYCKANPDTSSIPFLCLRSLQGDMDDAVCRSIDLASKALGAEQFVDLVRWQIEFGYEEAAERLRLLVMHIASGTHTVVDPLAD